MHADKVIRRNRRCRFTSFGRVGIIRTGILAEDKASGSYPSPAQHPAAVLLNARRKNVKQYGTKFGGEASFIAREVQDTRSSLEKACRKRVFMKTKRLLMLLYYIFVPAVYLLHIRLAALWLKHAGGASNIGAVLVTVYGVFLVGIWVLIALLMRFSLLKWYVDPFAAAEAPLLMYVLMIAGQMKQAKSLHAALRLTNRELCDDGGMGWILLIALFCSVL